LTIVQEAIRMLEMEYESRLSRTELDDAIDYLSDKTKASVFIAMSSISRDRWLQRHINVQLDAKNLI
jgi:hypothetical protein